MALRPRSRLLLSVLVAVAVGLGLTAAACTTEAPPRKAFPELRWTHKQPLVIAAQGEAGGPVIVQEFTPPLSGDHVEHLMPLPPQQAIATWARDRLRTTGVGDRTLRVVIRDASVTEQALETKGGISGFFTDEPEARYEARVDVDVQLVKPDGTVERSNRLTGWRTKAISEKASLADREAAWFAMVEALMGDLDAQLGPGVQSNFGAALLR